MLKLWQFLKQYFWIPTTTTECDDLLTLILRRIDIMALDFKKLAEEVANVVNTQESAIQVITSLKDELKAVSSKLADQDADTEELDNLINKLDASTDALASAITTTPKE